MRLLEVDAAVQALCRTESVLKLNFCICVCLFREFSKESSARVSLVRQSTFMVQFSLTTTTTSVMMMILPSRIRSDPLIRVPASVEDKQASALELRPNSQFDASNASIRLNLAPNHLASFFRRRPTQKQTQPQVLISGLAERYSTFWSASLGLGAGTWLPASEPRVRVFHLLM